jgi:hypothetical protein
MTYRKYAPLQYITARLFEICVQSESKNCARTHGHRVTQKWRSYEFQVLRRRLFVSAEFQATFQI